MNKEQVYPSEDVFQRYMSPKQNKSKEFYRSPSSKLLQEKYPHSHKYQLPNPQPSFQQEPRHSPPLYRPTQQTPIQVSQFAASVNELRLSLMAANDTKQRLQEELIRQRSKVCEFEITKRRLQQQLERMQFEMERLGNYDRLQERQANIKMENLVRQNSRLSQQVSDLLQQNRQLKSQQRKIMSQCNVLLREKQVLIGQNQGQLKKLTALQNQLKIAKHNKQPASLSPPRIEDMVTFRSQNISLSPKKGQEIQASVQLQDDLILEQQHRRLMQDYESLLQQNHSMKKLYSQFYRNSEKSPGKSVQNKDKISITKLKQQTNSRKQTPIARFDSSHKKQEHSYSNQEIKNFDSQAERGGDSSSRDKLMLKTMQKKQIQRQFAKTRDIAIDQLRQIYTDAINVSKLQKKNSLRLFSETIMRKINKVAKMASNYLQLRADIKQDTGTIIPTPFDQIALTNKRQSKVMDIFKSVKQKAKQEGQLGYTLAIFRILTLISKAEDIGPDFMDNLKHSALKYLYKIHQKLELGT